MLAGIIFLAVVVAGLSALFGENSLPEPFGEPGDKVGFGTYAWQGGLMIAALVLAGRFLIAGLLLRIGWAMVPREEREAVEAMESQSFGGRPPERP